MGNKRKRKNQSKRSTSKLPKGLPNRNTTTNNANVFGGSSSNPFEMAQQHRQKRAKHPVLNRPTSVAGRNTARPSSALAEALKARQFAVTQDLKSKKKANAFVDKRIAHDRHLMTADEQNLARLVRERTRRSKRSTKFALEEDNDNHNNNNNNTVVLTHRGKAVDKLSHDDYVMLSDEDEEDLLGGGPRGGDLDALDTEMLHFGAGNNSKNNTMASIYGNSSSAQSQQQHPLDMSMQYSERKTDLDEWIQRRKLLKLQKLKSKEMQHDTFAAMDEQFAQLAEQLHFRDKEKDIREHLERKRAGTLSKIDQEFADWDVEMKRYMYVDKKVPATDRTKTPEEIAQEQADRLHQLETRRLARMNGDFDDDDDLSDVEDSDNDYDDDDATPKKKQQKRRRKDRSDHPEALDNDSDNEEDDKDELQVRFTADGLVHVNKEGLIVGKVGDSTKSVQPKLAPTNNDEDSGSNVIYAVGTKVIASYRAKEQYDGNESWFGGVIAKVNRESNGRGTVTYDIDYDDGDFEQGVETQHIKIDVEKAQQDLETKRTQHDKEVALKRKRQKAQEKARSEIPFVFEVPTTLEALHDMISNYATTGKDVSLIIQRIHKANSVRLDKRNKEKMQNFYDVLIRRFVAVGDAIHHSGNGGEELGRYSQLDVLTQTLYSMAQESAESAAAVWSRRLGIFQSAHAKRLRDAALGRGDEDEDEEEFTAWPSTGVILALRAIGHIFPVTDKRHHVVTPTILFLGQLISHTPILSVKDLVMGMMCCGLLIEYTKEAKRIAPEAHAFLASVIRLFARDPDQRGGEMYPLITLAAASDLEAFVTLRISVSQCELGDLAPQLSLEAEAIARDDVPAAILHSALHLVETCVKNLTESVSFEGKEVFAEITNSILALKPKSKSDNSLPELLRSKVASVASSLSATLIDSRVPLQRRAGPSIREKAIVTLAPRLENPDKYSFSRDKGKNATQAAADRARREYKREHKAVGRELRLDNAIVENERRREAAKKDAAARAKRQKAFAWLESEQAVMNQQVRQGGGLLQGGGTGAAKAKAASGKLGIKKGGKF